MWNVAADTVLASGVSSEVLTLFGTILASALALGAAIYTANQSRRAQEQTAEQASEAADRESQRRVQLEMLNLLRAEVETLNKRLSEMRDRLIAAEDESDAERRRRRAMEAEVDEMKHLIDRMKRILGEVAPDSTRAQYPDLFGLVVVTPPPNNPPNNRPGA